MTGGDNIKRPFPILLGEALELYSEARAREDALWAAWDYSAGTKPTEQMQQARQERREAFTRYLQALGKLPY